MPAEILEIGTNAANSADQIVTAGTPLTVCLKSATAPIGDTATVDILLKADNGAYFKVDYLAAGRPALMIMAAGTYRFSRPAVKDACGVFSG